MKCKLCGEPAQLRDDHTYRAHDNAKGIRCAATGLHPDGALAQRRSFAGDKAGTRLRLVDVVDGIGINSSVNVDAAEISLWIAIDPDTADRLAVELIEMAAMQRKRAAGWQQK
jgi:hypothetical protein